MFKNFQIATLKVIYYISLLLGLILIWVFPIGTIIGVILLLMAYGSNLEIKEVETRYDLKNENNKQDKFYIPWHDEIKNKKSLKETTENKIKVIQETKKNKEKNILNEKEELKRKFKNYIGFFEDKEIEIKDLYPYLRPRNYIIIDASGRAEYNFTIGMPQRLYLFMNQHRSTKGTVFQTSITYYKNPKDIYRGCICIHSHTADYIAVNTISLKKLDDLLSNALAVLVNDIRNAWDENELIKEYKNKND